MTVTYPRQGRTETRSPGHYHVLQLGCCFIILVEAEAYRVTDGENGFQCRIDLILIQREEQSIDEDDYCDEEIHQGIQDDPLTYKLDL